METQAERLAREAHEEIFSTDPSSPGLAMRMDRLERLWKIASSVVPWLVCGSILWKVIEEVARSIARTS